MVLSYWGYTAGGSSATPAQQIAYVRKTIVYDDGNATGETNGNELAYGVSHYKDGTTNGLSYSILSQVDPEGPSSASQEAYMAWAIENNEPAIVLINAKDFGRSYSGHWLVVIGFSSDGTTTNVILNDPDNQAARKGYPNWIVGGPGISVSLSTFGKALKDGPTDYNIAAIEPYI